MVKKILPTSQEESHAIWNLTDDSEILRYVYDRTRLDQRILWQNLSDLLV